MQAGPFAVQFVPVSHSIPESAALIIDTPAGRVFHTGDWKIDDQPVIGSMTDAPAIRALVKAMEKQYGPEKGNSRYLYKLFPEGPAKQATKIAGLPKPVKCI